MAQLIYTLTTRARSSGFFFERHELHPLGITTESKCWGLWVEGRGFDKACRLDGVDTDEVPRALKNESPHLVVSAIHPDLWPGAFNLQVLLQRRQSLGKREIREHVDSHYGLYDALDRCGVNVLLVQTAQVGYDMISVSATCDFPHLRPAILSLLESADQHARSNHASRSAADEEKSFVHRVNSFKALGLLLLPRLAQLEARLLAIDDARWHYSLATMPGPNHDQGKADAMITKACEEPDCSLLIGPDVAKLPLQARRDKVTEALSTAWFLNRRVVAVGENSYFLSYYATSSASRVRESTPKGFDVTSLAEAQESDLAKLPGLTKVLYGQLYSTLRARTPVNKIGEVDGLLLQSLAESPSQDGKLIPQSGTVERLHRAVPGIGNDGAKVAAAMETACLGDFFRAQALVPIRIHAMPSLAYSRFWAFRSGPMQFKYDNNLLYPVGAAKNQYRLDELIAFLATATGTAEDPISKFGPHMAVMANISLPDRFVRLRFFREVTEPLAYLTVRVKLKVVRPARTGQRDRDYSEAVCSSKGLLRHITKFLLLKSFRIERTTNVLLDGDADDEVGRWEFMVRATNEAAIGMCKLVACMSDSELSQLERDWSDEFVDHMEGNRGWQPPEFDIRAGIVPPER